MLEYIKTEAMYANYTYFTLRDYEMRVCSACLQNVEMGYALRCRSCNVVCHEYCTSSDGYTCDDCQELG